MSDVDPKSVVIRFLDEIVNAKNPEAAPEVLAEDHVLHPIDGSEPIQGGPLFATLIAGIRVSFPDWHNTLEDLVAEGDRVAFRYVEGGTHRGEFDGIAATGRVVVARGIDIVRIEDGKIAETWVSTDIVPTLRAQILD
jgi:predicted ester cyclase